MKATPRCHLEEGDASVRAHAAFRRISASHPGDPRGTQRAGGPPRARCRDRRARALGLRRLSDGRGRVSGRGQQDHDLSALAEPCGARLCSRGADADAPSREPAAGHRTARERSRRGIHAAIHLRSEGRGPSLGTAARRAISTPRSKRSSEMRWTSVATSGGRWSRAPSTGVKLPPGTDAQLLLDLVRAIVDSRSSSRRLDTAWLTLAVRTVIAGARAGTLVRGRGAPRRACPLSASRAEITIAVAHPCDATPEGEAPITS